MHVVRCESPQAFLGRAEAFLLADEACHNLLLGVPAILMARGAKPAPPPYFAVVVDAGEVVAAAMMTPPHQLVLSRTERPRALGLIAQDLLTAKMMPPGVHGPVPVSEPFAGVWQTLTGQRCEQIRDSRIYRLGRVSPPAGAPGRLRPAAEADRSMLISWVQAFFAEAFGGHAPPANPEELVDRRLGGSTEGLYLWDDEGPRALAGYTGPTPHGIRVGPVYTPPGHRNRGYASACVAALSQLLLDRGYGFCFLYTDLANPTSNRIYRQIGYEPVCDVVEYRFLSR
ncbi:MAG TPA: GNAT family N-acetyltransferase [bacterium]|nr:GNAT family N-acetyltransferase [bacterium]